MVHGSHPRSIPEEPPSPRCGTNCAARSTTSNPGCRPRFAASRSWSTISATFTASSWRLPATGSSQPELRRYVEFLRRELLLVPDVKKVDLFSEQQEVVFLEISRQRLAQLGINEEQIYGQLQAKNVAADGGRLRVGDEHIAIDPTGGFRLGRRHARVGDRVRTVRAANCSSGTSRPSAAATKIRRAACCGTTASRPSAWASPRCRAATW